MYNLVLGQKEREKNVKFDQYIEGNYLAEKCMIIYVSTLFSFQEIESLFMFSKIKLNNMQT